MSNPLPPDPLSPPPVRLPPARLPPLVEYVSLPKLRRTRSWAISEILCWFLVLVLVGITAVTAATETDQGAVDAVTESQLQLSAKYAVGVHAVMPTAATSAQAMKELDDLAKTPEARLRVAIVSGELVNRDEALRRLEGLGQGNPALSGDVSTAESLCSGVPVDDATLAAFREKWEWFGDLAASFAKPPTDPLRTAVLAAAYRVILVVAGVVIAGGGAGLAGLALMIVGIVMLVRGRLVPAFEAMSRGVALPRLPQLPLPGDRRAYIAGFAWYLGLYFGISFLLRFVAHVPNVARLALGLAIASGSVAMGLLWPRIKAIPDNNSPAFPVVPPVRAAAMPGGAIVSDVSEHILPYRSPSTTWSQWRAATGLHAGRGLFREVFAGIVGYLAGLPLLGLSLLVVTVLIKLSGATPTHPINGPIETGGWLVIVLVFLLASVWAPITEELMFRGVLYAHLRERWGWLSSSIVVGLIFGLVHPQGWTVLPFLATMGFVLASIREWRGSIIPGMVAHSLHNTLTLTFALLVMR